MPEPEWVSQIDPRTRSIEALRVILHELQCEHEPTRIEALIQDGFFQLRTLEGLLSIDDRA